MIKMKMKIRKFRLDL